MNEYTDQQLDQLLRETVTRQEQVHQLQHAIIAHSRRRHRRRLLLRMARLVALTFGWSACVIAVIATATALAHSYDTPLSLPLIICPTAAMIATTVYLLYHVPTATAS